MPKLALDKQGDAKYHALNIMISLRLRDTIRQVAFDEGISIAEYCRRAIESYLKTGMNG